MKNDYKYLIRHKPKWLYRLESISPDNGLWYDAAGNYVWGCKNCSGSAKDLPMDFDERYHVDNKNWFSSCSTKEDLLHWYSLEDANYLIANGFVFTKYLAKDYIEYPTQETVFLKDTALERVELNINDLFRKPLAEEMRTIAENSMRIDAIKSKIAAKMRKAARKGYTRITVRIPLIYKSIIMEYLQEEKCRVIADDIILFKDPFKDPITLTILW